MAGSKSDEPRQAVIDRAIREAARFARDDAEFVRLLRARVRSASEGRAGVRTRGAAVGFGADRRARSPHAETAARIEHRIYRDPRFLENARRLARLGARTRILGGSDVRGRVFEDCVAVGNDERFGCTGTLIAPHVVVTAGHCGPMATRIFVGNDIDRRGKEYEVQKRIPHPRYGRPEHANDLLVLLLKRPVMDVPPRAIASSAEIDAARVGRAVGFGNTEETGSIGYGIKRQVDIPIASIACRGHFEGDADAEVYGCVPGREIVAGKALLARDSCTGDSGGPFYVADSHGQWRLAGATSRATDSAGTMCGDGGIYVRIDAYLDWIEEVAKIKFPRDAAVTGKPKAKEKSATAPAKAKAKAKSKPKPKSKQKSKPKSKPKPKPKAKGKSKSKTQPRPKTRKPRRRSTRRG